MQAEIIPLTCKWGPSLSSQGRRSSGVALCLVLAGTERRGPGARHWTDPALAGVRHRSFVSPRSSSSTSSRASRSWMLTGWKATPWGRCPATGSSTPSSECWGDGGCPGGSASPWGAAMADIGTGSSWPVTNTDRPAWPVSARGPPSSLPQLGLNWELTHETHGLTPSHLHRNKTGPCPEIPRLTPREAGWLLWVCFVPHALDGRGSLTGTG